MEENCYSKLLILACSMLSMRCFAAASNLAALVPAANKLPCARPPVPNCMAKQPFKIVQPRDARHHLCSLLLDAEAESVAVNLEQCQQEPSTPHAAKDMLKMMTKMAGAAGLNSIRRDCNAMPFRFVLHHNSVGISCGGITAQRSTLTNSLIQP